MQIKGNERRGFTLIELLVSIGIIALLSTIILASLAVARTKSRDSQRVSNLQSVMQALALYHNDFNAYPDLGQASGWADIGGSDADYSGLELALVPGYLQASPVDPGGRCAWYQVLNGGQGYILAFEPERSEVLATDHDCLDPTTDWYCLGENWQ